MRFPVGPWALLWMKVINWLIDYQVNKEQWREGLFDWKSGLINQISIQNEATHLWLDLSQNTNVYSLK